MTVTMKNPRAGRRGGSGNTAALGSDRGRHATAALRPTQAPRLPRNWRARLPDPETYYHHARVAKLSAGHSNGWAQGRCPFHDDRNASLSVRLDGERGHWRCFAGCGQGDLVSFHMRLSSLNFVEAVRDLVGGAYDRRT